MGFLGKLFGKKDEETAVELFLLLRLVFGK